MLLEERDVTTFRDAHDDQQAILFCLIMVVDSNVVALLDLL